MTTLVMEDVLSKMEHDALEDKLLFMAAAYSASNSDDWTKCALQQVSDAEIMKDLNHNLLVKLHDDISANRASENLVKVLNLIPSAYSVAAFQAAVRKLQNEHAFEVQTCKTELITAQQMTQCYACKRYVTRYQVDHDPGQCVIYKHTSSKMTNAQGQSVYGCCNSTSDVGCMQRQQKHLVSGYARDYRNY
jgi:hypothetical protein